MNTFRIGHGYDVHRLVRGRDLVIGGIKIPYHKGAKGHSDADALVHAICDALLGAACLKDIGQLFPDTDPQFKNISSTILLQKVNELLLSEGYRIGNVDSTVVLQEPAIGIYIPEIRKKLAGILNIAEPNVSVKATTTEGLGFIGQGEGIAAEAVVAIFKT